MKLYTTNPAQDNASAGVLVAADLTGQAVEVVIVNDETLKSADFKAKNVTGNLPILETAEGTLQEPTAIVTYLARLAGGKLLGANDVQKAHVDQWISFTNTSLVPAVLKVNTGIFGTGEISQNDWNEAAKNLKAHVKTLNTALEGKKFIAGNEITLADYILAMALMRPLQTTLDAGFRKAMKNVGAWAESVYAQESVKKVCGNVQLAAKALKPVVTVEKKKEEKKKAAPAPAAPKKKEEKPKDNVESLPPTSFNLYDFKTLFVNHPDKAGKGVDTWYEMLDWEGWSFWHFHYDIYEGEGDKLHITNNLMNGFLNRAEHTSKYTFARQAVLGEEGGLQIMGVWLLRGQEIPDGLQKEHPQFEYYRSRKLDPRNNKDDDKLVREYFGGKEGDMMSGLKCQTLKWHK